MHHVCPMVPGGSQHSVPVDPVGGMDDPDDDERYIMAAKRARSTSSMKEGMYEETTPSLLAQLSQNPAPSNLELSLMLAQARAAQERAIQETLQRNSMDSAVAGSVLAGGAPASLLQGQRSRKSKDPKRLNPSASPSEEELPQSEPEDLSSKKISEEDPVDLNLLAITTTSEVPPIPDSMPTPTTLSQMPIANK